MCLPESQAENSGICKYLSCKKTTRAGGDSNSQTACFSKIVLDLHDNGTVYNANNLVRVSQLQLFPQSLPQNHVDLRISGCGGSLFYALASLYVGKWLPTIADVAASCCFQSFCLV